MALTQINPALFAGSSNTTAVIQSNGTTAITVDASQRVGIGTSSPNDVLEVAGNDAYIRVNRTGNEPGILLTYSNSATNRGNIAVTSGGAMYFTSGGNTERMRIDSAGSVAIGSTSTASATRLTLKGAGTGGNTLFNCQDSGGTGLLTLSENGKLIMASNANGLLGQIQAGITANSASTNSVITSTCNSSGPYPFGARGETNTQGLFGFFDGSNNVIGSITKSGSNVAYNTSSDYRLKENIAPMTGALAKVAQLKPVTYTWKADGLDGEGFIAHELAEVKPHAVFGEKDAVDEHGGIKPQGIDTSFLVATLTAAIQELKAELDTVKVELVALRNK
jgi:hypothetical protein